MLLSYYFYYLLFYFSISHIRDDNLNSKHHINLLLSQFYNIFIIIISLSIMKNIFTTFMIIFLYFTGIKPSFFAATSSTHVAPRQSIFLPPPRPFLQPPAPVRVIPPAPLVAAPLAVNPRLTMF